MNNKRDLVREIIAKSAGQANIISVPVMYVDLFGDIESAIFVSQLVYWSDRSIDGWIYKTYDNWYSEIRLKKKRIMKVKANLENLGIIETKVQKANGNPTVHYCLHFDRLIDFIEQNVPNNSQKEPKRDYGKCQNGTNESVKMELTKVSKWNFPLTDITTYPTSEPTEHIMREDGFSELRNKIESANIILTNNDTFLLLAKIWDEYGDGALDFILSKMQPMTASQKNNRYAQQMIRNAVNDGVLAEIRDGRRDSGGKKDKTMDVYEHNRRMAEEWLKENS